MRIIILFLLMLSGLSDITIENAWIRSSAKGTTTACFMEITNNSNLPDTLYNASASFANIVEIHETFKKDDMMGMRKVDNLIIDSNGKLILKPRSYHIMLIDLKKSLKENSTEELTLYFKNAGKIKVKAKVNKMEISK